MHLSLLPEAFLAFNCVSVSIKIGGFPQCLYVNPEPAVHRSDLWTSNVCQFELFSPGVQPVMLTPPGQNYDNVAALVTGWGALYTDGPFSDLLQAAFSPAL